MSDPVKLSFGGNVGKEVPFPDGVVGDAFYFNVELGDAEDCTD